MSNQKKVNRREIIKGSAAVVAAGAMGIQVAKANDKMPHQMPDQMLGSGTRTREGVGCGPKPAETPFERMEVTSKIEHLFRQQWDCSGFHTKRGDNQTKTINNKIRELLPELKEYGCYCDVLAQEVAVLLERLESHGGIISEEERYEIMGFPTDIL